MTIAAAPGRPATAQGFHFLLEAPAHPGPIALAAHQVHVAAFGQDIDALCDGHQAAGVAVVGIVKINGPAQRIVLAHRVAYDIEILHLLAAPESQLFRLHGPPDDLLVTGQLANLLGDLLLQRRGVYLILVRRLVVESDLWSDVGHHRPAVLEAALEIRHLIAVYGAGNRESVGQIPCGFAGIAHEGHLTAAGIDAVGRQLGGITRQRIGRETCDGGKVEQDQRQETGHSGDPKHGRNLTELS